MVLYGEDRAKFIKENSIWGTYDRVPVYFIISTQLSEILKLFNEYKISQVCIAVEALEALLVEQFVDIGSYYNDLTRLLRNCDVTCKQYNECKKLEREKNILLKCEKKSIDYLLDTINPGQRVIIALRKYRLLVRHMRRAKMLPQREIIKDVEPETFSWDSEEEKPEAENDKNP